MITPEKFGKILNKLPKEKMELSKVELSQMSEIDTLTKEVKSIVVRHTKLVDLMGEVEKRKAPLTKEKNALQERLSVVEKEHKEVVEELDRWESQYSKSDNDLNTAATELYKKVQKVKASAKELGISLNIGEAEKALWESGYDKG
tara:strand:- start:41 stop:475 length:435 start_codon:yes stop_codon:yes gene_type:complete